MTSGPGRRREITRAVCSARALTAQPPGGRGAGSPGEGHVGEVVGYDDVVEHGAGLGPEPGEVVVALGEVRQHQPPGTGPTGQRRSLRSRHVAVRAGAV